MNHQTRSVSETVTSVIERTHVTPFRLVRSVCQVPSGRDLRIRNRRVIGLGFHLLDSRANSGTFSITTERDLPGTFSSRCHPTFRADLVPRSGRKLRRGYLPPGALSFLTPSRSSAELRSRRLCPPIPGHEMPSFHLLFHEMGRRSRSSAATTSVFSPVKKRNS